MKRLKQAKELAQAFSPSNLKQGLDHARKPKTQAEIDAMVAQLTPEQRAKYEANMAAVERGRQQSQQVWEENKAREDNLRILKGPAGDALYGPGMADVGTPAELERLAQEQGVFGVLQHQRELQKGQFKQTVKQSFNRMDPPQIQDPAQRAEHAARERGARDSARAPYRSPHATPVEIHRVATRGKTQVQEVLDHLNQAGIATDRVFGVYRVPDRVSQLMTPHSEKGRIVEWDVVHSPGESRVPRLPLVATSFSADEQWVAKRVGEPSVLDEDLALAFCLGAQIAPEYCAGLARVSEFRSLQGSGDELSTGTLMTLVRGIVAFHPPAGTAYDQMLAAAPLHLGPARGIHIDVLNWGAVADAVHSKIHHPPPVPSPFPYLPATPQELIRAYIEVVGLQPGDSYSTQATVHRARGIRQAGFITTNVGPKQPCADGEHRMRSHAGQHVVFVYRDRPEYAEGRQRWAAYTEHVLQASLHNGLGLRPPVSDPDVHADTPGFLRPIFRAVEKVEKLHPDYWFDDWGREEVNPHRYCWPPVG